MKQCVTHEAVPDSSAVAPNAHPRSVGSAHAGSSAARFSGPDVVCVTRGTGSSSWKSWQRIGGTAASQRGEEDKRRANVEAGRHFGKTR